MSITVQSGLTLTFDRFWKWLLDHPNCILRAGTVDALFYDMEEFHWHLMEDEHHMPVVQIIRGKNLVGEIVIDTRDLLFVQVTPETEGDTNRFLFEVIGGPKGDTYAAYHFLMAHGFEEQEVGHLGGLKH